MASPLPDLRSGMRIDTPELSETQTLLAAIGNAAYRSWKAARLVNDLEILRYVDLRADSVGEIYDMRLLQPSQYDEDVHNTSIHFAFGSQ